MASKCLPMQAFVELIPLSPASHSTTLIRSNLRYIACELRTPQFTTTPVQRCIIKLSFASILGRQCFSFGSSRSNDYQLPKLDDIAPHHFIIFFHPDESTLYIRNTCSQGIHVSSKTQKSFHINTCDESFPVTSPMRLQIGNKKEISFEVVVPQSLGTQKYENDLAIYFNSLKQQIPAFATEQGRCTAKKRQGSVMSEDGREKKRQLCACPAVATSLPSSHEVIVKEEITGWFARISRALGGLLGTS
ncbi:Nn.00g007450.m01.CDS01 [Neocucurbitaria sp. VM-36]